MTTLQRLNHVRSLVGTQFAKLHGDSIDQSTIESLLICNGHYCGRRFRQGDISAVWFAEEDELKIYDEDGVCIDSLAIDLPANSENDRQAA